MKIFVVDVETTGLDPEKCAVVEFAVVPLVQRDDDLWEADAGMDSLVNPGMPIPPEASGVHHIVDSDVARAPTLNEASIAVFARLGPPERTDLWGAHNAPFDRSFLACLPERSWIDTYRCSKHLFPDSPNGKNGTLFYLLGGVLPGWAQGLAPHRALFDAMMTASVLRHMLTLRTAEELVALSSEPVVLRVVRFGKHSGKLWTEVPGDYLSWAEKQDMDADVKHTISHEIARRRRERG